MKTRHAQHSRREAGPRLGAGFTLIELMVAMTISLLILAALVGIFVNMSRNTNELAKTNSLIENGRFSIQLLEEDLMHAGYWGGYIPEFDDLATTVVPGDVPQLVPDPCQDFSIWDNFYRDALMGISVQAYQDLATETTCGFALAQRAGTDVLVVRHAENCVPGVGNCDADVAGRVYLQPSFCAAEKNAGTAQTANFNSITLDASASSVNNDYVGLTLHTLSGIGAGQFRTVTDYNGATKEAIIAKDWVTVPDNTTTYAFEYMLGTGSFPLHKRDCVGTGTPATLPITAGTIADKRRLISDIYYISDIAHPDRAGEVVPTLVRSQLDFAGGNVAQQPPVPLIEGVEGLRVELGIDDVSDTGEPVDYTTAVTWVDPNNQNSPRNRGDGSPDSYVHCTTGTPCSVAQLTNVVAVKLYVLARSREPTPGYIDNKTYCLGELDPDGTCPAANKIAAANDSYKRHVFTTSVRLTNVSGRRETP